MHVVVPLARRYEWDTAKGFSEAVVKKLAEAVPQRFVAKSGPKNRVGRIFVDYLRNGMSATTASAFSARARAGLGVSMTIDLKQLQEVTAANQWTIVNSIAYLKKRKTDPWRDYAKAQQQRLETAARRLGYSLKSG
jgi:bifunctional non-homologous end joining protein LigD